MEVIQKISRMYPALRNILLFIGIGIGLYVVRKYVMSRLYVYVKDSTNWYRVRKTVAWVNNIGLLLLFFTIFGNNLTGFSTTLGLAGAGIAYALREVIVSFAGWFEVLFGDFFKSGDRIMLAGIKGDVVDIGFLRTTLMELGEWVDGDQYTGRIVRVSNSSIFTSPVYNYTAHFEFLWDEITIPIRFGSDIEQMRHIALSAAHAFTSTLGEEATQQWIDMQKTYKLEETSLEPQVYVTFNDNWIDVTVRYVVYFNKHRGVTDKLFTAILDEIEQTDAQIELASETVEIIRYTKK